MNALGDEIARRGDAPSRQPVLGSGHPLGDIFLLKHDPTAAELAEGVAFYGRVGQAVLKSVQRLSIDPLLVYGTNVVKLGGDHGRDESELAERVYPMWLLRELHIVQPKIVVVMGEDTLAVVNGLDLALAQPLDERARHDPAPDADDRGPRHPVARALARRCRGQARLLGRVPRARRVVRGAAAVLSR